MKRILLTAVAACACISLTAAACGSGGGVEKSDPQEPARDRAFWGNVAEGMSQALIKHFWGPSFPGYEDKYYFYYGSDLSNLDTYHYWPEAHAMDVIVDAYKRSGAKDYLDIYPLWWEGVPQFNWLDTSPALWWNPYVDDMEWIVLAQLRMYETARNEEYFARARQIYDDWIWTTWGPEGEAPWYGGITWKVDVRKSKNACSNGPAAIAAARLYNLYNNAPDRGGKPREAYLGEALKIYGWLRANLYRPSDGGVGDNMNASGAVSTRVHTYNQGTFIGAAVELYKILGDPQYIKDAVNAANYVIGEMSTGEGGVLRDSPSGDNGLFHGIFFRYFVQLVNLPDLDPADKARFKAWLTHQANVMYDEGINREYMLWGGEWHKAPEGSSGVCLTPQLSGCMLMEAMYVME